MASTSASSARLAPGAARVEEAVEQQDDQREILAREQAQVRQVVEVERREGVDRPRPEMPPPTPQPRCRASAYSPGALRTKRQQDGHVVDRNRVVGDEPQRQRQDRRARAAARRRDRCARRGRRCCASKSSHGACSNCAAPADAPDAIERVERREEPIAQVRRQRPGRGDRQDRVGRRDQRQPQRRQTGSRSRHPTRGGLGRVTCWRGCGRIARAGQPPMGGRTRHGNRPLDSGADYSTRPIRLP